ncbi:MAG: hypothetical protein AAB322_01425, partial [Pseudomonadota bacterium]
MSVLHSEPLKTQPLVAQLMALQVQPIAALERFKASADPANAALYRILGHPDALSEQRDALVAVIGQDNFQKLLATAKELNNLAGRDSAVAQALSMGGNPSAALQRFKEHFDGAGESVAGLEDAGPVSSVGTGLKSHPSGLKKYEPRQPEYAEPRAVAGSAFQYIEKGGKKFLELKVGKIVRTMEMGSGGPRAPRVKFVRPDVLEIAVGEKPFMVKLTEDNLLYMATMMEYLSDPDASLTNLMLR